LAAVSAATFLTATYFVTSENLWVSDNFRKRITSAYPKALVPRGLEGVESFDLKSDLFARDIVGQMGGEAEVCKYALTPNQIEELSDLQSEGVTGKLVTYRSGNMFYTVGKNGVLFVVEVGWDANDRLWNVDAWELDDNVSWSDDRVFRNTRVSEA